MTASVPSSRSLLVTNDLPPRPGGIQTFLAGLLARLPPQDVVVLASDWPGAAEADAALPYEVHRVPTSVLLPTPGVARRAVRLARTTGCTAAWFGAAAPLGLLAPALRRAGVRPAVALTHGHEVGWGLVPGARQALRRVGREVDAVTAVSGWTAARLAPVLGEEPSRLSPGVDTDVFVPDDRRPGSPAAQVRARHGLARDQPVVVCVSRLMPRKGQDTLVRLLPRLRAAVPGTTLLLVGGGPRRQALAEQARALGVADAVRLTGSVPAAELPAHYAAGDVFAMPCRTRAGGADVEGLGIVYLEAAACGLPVVAGRSGGAPETVVDGVTGHVVDGRDDDAVLVALLQLLRDPAAAREAGRAGRRHVLASWTWEEQASHLRRLLLAPPAAAPAAGGAAPLSVSRRCRRSRSRAPS